MFYIAKLTIKIFIDKLAAIGRTTHSQCLCRAGGEKRNLSIPLSDLRCLAYTRHDRSASFVILSKAKNLIYRQL